MSDRITIRQMVDGISGLLMTSSEFKQTQGNESLTETVPEVAITQTYFQARAFVGTQQQANTFSGRRAVDAAVIRVKKTTIHVDIFARQRSSLGMDISASQDLVDVVDELLETQTQAPYFNLPQIKAFTYSVERLTFETNNVKYAGARFVLDLTSM